MPSKSTEPAAKGNDGSSATASAPPQGRLTLTTGVPVPTSTVSAATSVIDTPATGNLVRIWNGTADVMKRPSPRSRRRSRTPPKEERRRRGRFAGLRRVAWSDGRTVRVSRGPAWSAGAGSSNTLRGSGAGSTALNRVNGLLRNMVVITNGPAAGYGTYVRHHRQRRWRGDRQLQSRLCCGGRWHGQGRPWERLNNRGPVRGFVKDTVGAVHLRHHILARGQRLDYQPGHLGVGLQEDWWRADYSIVAAGDSTGSSTTGIGFNSTTAPTGFNGYLPSSGSANQTLAAATVQPIGSNYLAPLEYVSAGTKTFDGGGYFAPIQPGMIWEGRY